MRFFLNFLDNPGVSGLNSLRILDLIGDFFAAKGDFTRLNIRYKEQFSVIVSLKQLIKGGLVFIVFCP